jgi:CheY-like chemotaxis protein
VDDERSIRVLCRVNLEIAGVEVFEAADGEQALEAVAAAKPDLVLLDVMMPGVDGWAVAERLAGDPASRDLPIVFLTALAEGIDRERALNLGAVGYIVKPFDPVALPGALTRLLARLRRGEREAIRKELRAEP